MKILINNTEKKFHFKFLIELSWDTWKKKWHTLYFLRFIFIFAEELQEIDLDRVAKISKAYKTKLKKKQGPMHKRTKDILDKFYRPYNEELARLLNDSRFLWKLNWMLNKKRKHLDEPRNVIFSLKIIRF